MDGAANLAWQVEIDRARLTQLTAAKKSTDIHNQELQVEVLTNLSIAM